MSIRLALIGIAVLASTVFAQGRTGPTRDELELMQLPLEADSTVVAGVLGRPDSVAYADFPGTVGRRLAALHYRSSIVHLGPDGLKQGVTILGPDIATARGLRVGHTRSRVTALYGAPNGRSAAEWRYDIEHDEYGPELIVRFRQDRVTSIFIGYTLK